MKDEIVVEGEKYVKKSTIKEKVKLVIPKGKPDNPFMEIGMEYFIRTVTHYFTGRLIWVGEKEIALEDVAWIADTGRFNQFVKGETVNEVEPFPQGSKVIVGRGAIIDMVERIGGLLLTVK
jgi:hypothetical protein